MGNVVSVRGTWLIKPTTAGGRGAGFQALAAFAAGGVFVATGPTRPAPGWANGARLAQRASPSRT